MPRWSSLPRPFLAALATVFAAAAVLHGSLWMYEERFPGPRVELGFNRLRNEQYDARTHSIRVGDVVQGSPAEQAGLRAGDRIIGVNGQALETSAPYDEAYARGRPGDAVELTVERLGELKPLTLHGVFRASTLAAAREGLARSSAQQVTRSFPVLFLVVGFAVLFLRLDDPNAWLLALLFCAFVAAPSFSNPLAMPPVLRAFAFAFRAVFDGMLCSLFYLFFAVFPARSPIDRRFPWLKWAGLALGVSIAVPGLLTGDAHFPHVLTSVIGEHSAEVLRRSLTYALIGLGLVSLAGNSFAAAVPAEARRKSRVILWGTVVGVLPIVSEAIVVDFGGYSRPFWLDTAFVILVLLYPLSFAYAVVKHRVLEIPVLLRRSARYVLVQRGFIVLLFVVAACTIALFTHAFSRLFQTGSNVGMMLSAAFGIALVWASAPLVKRGTKRIDRAFFRSAYDARIILEDLAEKTRAVVERRQLAALLERHVREALHPKTLACYLEAGDGRLAVIDGAVRPALEAIAANAPMLAELARRGKAWDVPPAGTAGAEECSVLAPLAPECLVPILGRDSRLIGMLVLGERLAEEPYSGEDKHLLDSVAGQAGTALENIRLAERMADRMAADRRAAHEMEIAREVQARLFPQAMPRLETLEYTGACIQAREVGGDYYDFLDLGPGRVGIVLADISGKGIAGALLMANLQANLRSQYAVALEDLSRLLRSVNRLFHENTPEDRYATLFFAVYDDTSRKLQYANCGHNAPLLLRASGEVERLGATATVLGLFRDWNCETRDVTLHSGDTLVIYTDGITEACDAADKEFGEERLVETIRKRGRAPVKVLLAGIQEAVEKFNEGRQADDLTLVIARAE